jgi:hypothetical protein
MNLLQRTHGFAPRLHQLGRISAAGAIAACLLVATGQTANADNINPIGTTTSVNSGTYDYNNTNAETGYLNNGTLDVSSDLVNPGYPQFDYNSQGLTNNYGTAAVSGGSFDQNIEGLVNWFGAVNLTGGSFDSNSNTGFNNYGGTATVSGGSFDDNYIGLNNSGTTSLTGGSFSGNGFDLWAYDGTLSIYGTAFSVGGNDFSGDLPQGTGSFNWTQANGNTQTLSYDIFSPGNIDLVQVAAAPEASSFVLFGVLLAMAGAAIVLRSRRHSRADQA